MAIRVKYVGGPGECSSLHTQIIHTLQEKTFGYIQEKVEYNHWWIAYSDGQPVAFASLYKYPDNPTTAFLSLCGVLPSHRGLGLQRRLVQARVAKAKKLGIKRIISYTSIDNAPSANNLFSCGFRIYVPRWEWGVKNAIYFRKLLEP